MKYFCHRSLGRIKSKEIVRFFGRNENILICFLKFLTFTVYIRLILRKIRTFFLLLRSFFMGVFPPTQCKFLRILVGFCHDKSNRNSQELTVCPLEDGHLPGFFERKIPPQMSYVILGGPYSCQFVVFPTKSLNIKKVYKTLQV